MSGRPSIRTDAVDAEICERLAKGEPLAVICRDEHMPHRSTVYDWENADPELSRRIARAREDGFDQIAHDCLAIADDKSSDVRIIGGDFGPLEVANTEFIQRSKVRIETRLKLLSKWDPSRYGDRVAMEHSGPNGGPLQHVVDRPPVETREQWLERRRREVGDVGTATGTSD